MEVESPKHAQSDELDRTSAASLGRTNLKLYYDSVQSVSAVY